MFRVSNNIDPTIPNKKKLLFISTMPSNETSSFEAKNIENPKNLISQEISNSSSLSAPPNIPKKTTKYFGNSNNNHTIKKIFPMKRIFFRLYRVNFLNPKKERIKNQSKNKKQNNIKKNVNNILKNKPNHLSTKINNNTFNNKNYSAGRWKSDEHKRFIDAIIRYGNNWRQVQKYVGTRSSTQTRSHAQKFFEKLKRSHLFKKDKYDFSKNSLKILHDIMQNLPVKEYEITLKALHSLSYDKNTNYENENEKILQNNNNDFNINDYCNEKNNIEKINYDGNYNNLLYEENKRNFKFCNQGNCFLESNNNKIFINDEYLLYNNSISNGNHINNINNNNNYLFNEMYTNDIKSFGRKESDFFNQRKNSLSEINAKDLKEQNDISDDNDLDYNLNYNLFNNNLNLNANRDNKINNNKLFENSDEKIGYKQLFNNQDFIFNQQSSRKMSLEENINS